MARYQSDFKTFDEALTQGYTVDQLALLARQISKDLPTRKAELVRHVSRTVFSDPQAVLQKLEQKTLWALAEAVHNWNGSYHDSRFQSKYKAAPCERPDVYKQKMPLFFLFLRSL